VPAQNTVREIGSYALSSVAETSRQSKHLKTNIKPSRRQRIELCIEAHVVTARRALRRLGVSPSIG